LLDIYPARELQENFEGITSSWLLEKVTLDKRSFTLGELSIKKEKILIFFLQ
jgi:UDP-N-acetylmuramate--alanine ligase